MQVSKLLQSFTHYRIIYLFSASLHLSSNRQYWVWQKKKALLRCLTSSSIAELLVVTCSFRKFGFNVSIQKKRKVDERTPHSHSVSGRRHNSLWIRLVRVKLTYKNLGWFLSPHHDHLDMLSFCNCLPFSTLQNPALSKEAKMLVFMAPKECQFGQIMSNYLFSLMPNLLCRLNWSIMKLLTFVLLSCRVHEDIRGV